MRLHGYPGWLAWLFVHILNLIGFRNRLVVLVQWAWSYFSYQRAIRLITGSLPELDADASTAERPRPERDPANIAERPRPERGATPPSESERGWGPASTEK
jgi:NADH dehydrogenase